ncbi:MAG: insulinase family protein [Phycisphaerales bacterium]|nr:insulinase family protein [Phycisphaerales bacterium]
MLTERIPQVRSLALTWLLPAGVVHEPAQQLGVATVLAEMVCRGAGGLDARAHSHALEMLGVERDTQVMTRHMRLSAAMIGEKAEQALPLLMDMVLAPMLDEASLAPSVDLALQSLDALQDEPTGPGVCGTSQNVIIRYP